MDSSHQDKVPQTPVTPVLAEGLTSLHNLIKRDTHTLNRTTSIQRLERHIQKLAHAAQLSFAESALLYDQNQMLIRMNEAKVRRSTRSIVLGKAKIMSFGNIKVARAARAAKEVINGRGKRDRKRKSAAPEADEPEPESEVAQMIKAPEAWKAPVARMI